ncbi:hypothetical protein N7462_000817 [Penicillium macrosclerotiorum]|uniref:uncharacterized protein n=1 Tax=Penicillium macrosclerotiorum TaxID=303699 RepID=UPI002546AAAC|nr:uncharacterized protein N7462_000817 [Penicillium macrosclerotiorum]KAJ5698812.1 hypothetical protein N7462_000817 [Penicillium macrosclerotiorum]
MSGISSQSYEAFDPSLPTDQPFVTRASHFQFNLSSPYELAKTREESMVSQPWWKFEDHSFASTDYMAPELPIYTDHVVSWNCGLSGVSDPQSPRSNSSGSIPVMNCIASSSYPHEDFPIPTVDEQQVSYPAADTLINLDHSSMLPRTQVLEVNPDSRSSFDQYEFYPWSGSQSNCSGTPEQQWHSPLPADTLTLSQPPTRSKSRLASVSRVRKSVERCPPSFPGRSRRRRGVASADNADGNNPRIFVCSFAPYGCESTFVSKNEWKRHVTSQHLQLGFYRCDVGKCSVHMHQMSPESFLLSAASTKSRASTPPPGQPNDFNRKDLFTQHMRRMHAPWLQSGRRRTPTDAEHSAFETSLEDVRRRCWHGLRTPPQQSHCGFCHETFTGDSSWDARMEHVGRHFERDDHQALKDETEDLALREWGLREGILSLVDGKCQLVSLVGMDL